MTPDRIAASNPVDDRILTLRVRQVGWLEEPSGRIYRNWEDRSVSGFGSATPLYVGIEED